MRSTMVYRDKLWAKAMGAPERSAAELALQRKLWAASVAQSMYAEFVAIITCRVMYVAFRPHRFTFGFGYGFDANDEFMTSVSVLVASTFVELIFEGVVDSFALNIEKKNGIDLNDFWEMWREFSWNSLSRWQGEGDYCQGIPTEYAFQPGHCDAGVNAPALWGRTLIDGVLAILLTMWAFKLVPTYLFCKSLDPCSCTSSAGFGILFAFCNATSESLVGNSSSSLAANTTNDLIARARGEYAGVFDSLGGNVVSIIVGVAALILVVVFFLVADLFLELIKVGDEKAEIERRAKELLEKNLKIRKQVELDGGFPSKARAPTSLVAREFRTHRCNVLTRALCRSPPHMPRACDRDEQDASQDRRG